MLATSLSGLYSSLPRRVVLAESEEHRSGSKVRGSNEDLIVHGAGWHRLTKQDWSACEPLADFLRILDFCNLAIHVSLLFSIWPGQHILSAIVA